VILKWPYCNTERQLEDQTRWPASENSCLKLFHQRSRPDSEKNYKICDIQCDGWTVGYMATGREGQKDEQMFKSTLSLTSALAREDWLTPRHGCFTFWKENWYCTHCAGGWMDLGASLDWCG
jgi:hypothetical protein